jgi:hypothetical protein
MKAVRIVLGLVATLATLAATGVQDYYSPTVL